MAPEQRPIVSKPTLAVGRLLLLGLPE